MTDSNKEAGCKGKPPFNSMKRAVKVAKRMRRRRNEPVAPYRCKFCGLVHIGGTE